MAFFRKGGINWTWLHAAFILKLKEWQKTYLDWHTIGHLMNHVLCLRYNQMKHVWLATEVMEWDEMSETCPNPEDCPWALRIARVRPCAKSRANVKTHSISSMCFERVNKESMTAWSQTIHKRCFPFMIYTQPFTPYITIFSVSGTPRIPQNPVESSLVHRISQHIWCTLCNSRTFSSFKACSFQSASRHCSVVTEVAATDGASTASTTSPWSVPSVPCSCR